jgi:ketosteroid isomerase-like protein
MSTLGTSLSKDDVVNLEGTFDSALRLVRAGDWAGWAALYTEDAVVHPPNGVAVQGRSANQNWGQAFPPIEAVALSDFQVSGEGNLAYVTCRYTLTIKGLPPDTGKELRVLRRGTNGWQFVALSFNSDLPVPDRTK